MNIIKNKKASEGAEMTVGEIIGWVILFALAVFAFFWYSGIGNKIIASIKDIF